MHDKQILALWGSPGSGKTAVSAKLANMLTQKKKDVALLFCDNFVPVIPVLMPFQSDANKSLGNIISAPQITQENIFENAITLKKNNRLFLLGYRKGENVFTYPEYTKSNTVDLLIQLRHIADYVIVDCTSHISEDMLSTAALEVSDAVIRLCSCDLKGISYFASQLPYIMDRRFNPDRHIKALSNFKANEPQAEAKECYKGISFELPYIDEMNEQYQTGSIFENFSSREGKKLENTLGDIIMEVFNE